MSALTREWGFALLAIDAATALVRPHLQVMRASPPAAGEAVRRARSSDLPGGRRCRRSSGLWLLSTGAAVGALWAPQSRHAGLAGSGLCVEAGGGVVPPAAPHRDVDGWRGTPSRVGRVARCGSCEPGCRVGAHTASDPARKGDLS